MYLENTSVDIANSFNVLKLKKNLCFNKINTSKSYSVALVTRYIFIPQIIVYAGTEIQEGSLNCDDKLCISGIHHTKTDGAATTHAS